MVRKDFLILCIRVLAETLADHNRLLRKQDELESMSLEEGQAFNEKLMPIMRGAAQPNRKL